MFDRLAVALRKNIVEVLQQHMSFANSSDWIFLPEDTDSETHLESPNVSLPYSCGLYRRMLYIVMRCGNFSVF